LQGLTNPESSNPRSRVKKNPAKFITLINACCNLSNSNIAIEKHKPQSSTAPPPLQNLSFV